MGVMDVRDGLCVGMQLLSFVPVVLMPGRHVLDIQPGTRGHGKKRCVSRIRIRITEPKLLQSWLTDYVSRCGVLKQRGEDTSTKQATGEDEIPRARVEEGGEDRKPRRWDNGYGDGKTRQGG